jgi:hypothetical protein
MEALRQFSGYAIVVVIAIAFAYDWRLGVRVIGASEVLLGLYWLRMGRVSYGWRGRPSSGALTGGWAIAAALFVLALGVVLLVAPQFALPILCGSHRNCP